MDPNDEFIKNNLELWFQSFWLPTNKGLLVGRWPTKALWPEKDTDFVRDSMDIFLYNLLLQAQKEQVPEEHPMIIKLEDWFDFVGGEKRIKELLERDDIADINLWDFKW